MTHLCNPLACPEGGAVTVLVLPVRKPSTERGYAVSPGSPSRGAKSLSDPSPQPLPRVSVCLSVVVV